MLSYFLRFEGVNLDSFVYDTDRLPTIRGGSLLLLRAVGDVEIWLREASSVKKVETVSRGASAGLFRFGVEEPGAAEQAREQIERRLGEDPTLRHATFVVDCTPEPPEAEGGFRRAAERLLAKNRFRQMRSPSVAVTVAAEATGPCAVDRVRPAVVPQGAPRGGKESVSASVAVRTREGREAKQKFYDDETGKKWSDSMRFAYHFHQIADDRERGSLDGKIAVLHFDGNSFGEIQQRECTTWQRQQKFDKTLRNYRRSLLADILSEFEMHPEEWRGLENTYRFETLLWGGDEMIWVVPAWHGWWLLSFALERMADWNFEGVPLHHGAGLVFCHAKAPIRRIERLAEKLTSLAKEVGKDKHDPRSTAAYQVLESFDLAPESFLPFRAARSPGGAAEQMIVDGTNARQIAQSIRTLGSVLPRGKVYRAVAELAKNAAADDTEIKSLRGIAKAQGAEAALAGLERASASPAAAWFHLAELWDYLAEFSLQETEVENAPR